ncbi:MAG TPA: protein kinase [Polyangiaceae bacterium]|nr:protein kinase [Polyangiaceae bacterium]
MKLFPGELIDQKYRVVRVLGTGGMGSVYEAENIRVERRVAIKVMHRVRDQQDVTRFEREARAAQIGSPHIVQIFDLGYLPDGAPYMVMEYLAGETLGARLQRLGTLSASQLLPIAKQILDALGAAHRAGIIHRDLKPDNVFLARHDASDEETVKLLDFGISKFTDNARKPADVSLTRSGVAVGTPHYMSPEQVQGSREIDFRTDLYSLGVILYRCVAGQLPFHSEEVAPLLVQILLEAPKPVHELRPSVDFELSQLIAKTMARQAADRFQSAAELRAALTRWETGQTGPGAATPLVQQRPSAPPELRPMGTNAPWSSTASHVLETPRTLRNVVLAAALLLTGLAGAFLAFRIWSSGTRQPKELESAPSVVPHVVAQATSPIRADQPRTNPASSTVEAEKVPPNSVDAAPKQEKRVSALGRNPKPPAATFSAPPVSSAAAPPVDSEPATDAEEDGDNRRHLTRGVR